MISKTVVQINATRRRSLSRSWCALLLALAGMAGCGTTKSFNATEQLLMSDAVDRAVASIDFRDLTGQKVYFDTQYINAIKGQGFVNADYIISSLRQQLFAANCRLQEKMEDAQYVVEARVGALGTDSHDVTYGLPANDSLNSAAQLVPNSPRIPSIPEIALAKRKQQIGASKIAVFAYERESKRAVWQSGISTARSTARDTWVLGAGPFQKGTIYDGVQFAGAKLHLPMASEEDKHDDTAPTDDGKDYFEVTKLAPIVSADSQAVGFQAPVEGVRGPADTAGESTPEESAAVKQSSAADGTPPSNPE